MNIAAAGVERVTAVKPVADTAPVQPEEPTTQMTATSPVANPDGVLMARDDGSAVDVAVCNAPRKATATYLTPTSTSLALVTSAPPG